MVGVGSWQDPVGVYSYTRHHPRTISTLVQRSSFINNALVGGAGALGGAISGGGTNNGAGTGNPAITINNSTFANNSVKKSAAPFDGSGGALAFAQRAVITISNSTFSANRAEGSSFNANGGALYVVNNTDQFILTNDTFADNFAGWVGGAISNSQISGNPGGIVRNTLFSNNTADNGPNDWTILQHCSSELSDGGNNFQFPPRNANSNFFNEISCLQGKSAINQRSLPDFRDPQLATLADTGGPTQTIPLAHIVAPHTARLTTQTQPSGHEWLRLPQPTCPLRYPDNRAHSALFTASFPVAAGFTAVADHRWSLNAI